MEKVLINKNTLTEGTILLSQEDSICTFQLSKAGAGIFLPQLINCKERFLTFYVEVLEEHSLPMHLLVYVHGEDNPALEIRFGLLPGVKAKVCIDLNWLNAHQLFPEAMPGTLKIVCHGRRICRDEISHIARSSMETFHDVKIEIEDSILTQQYDEIGA